jgi:hypothetical protein
VELGADPYCKNKKLEGVVHIAAEAGFDYLLTYFAKDLGIRIDDKDSKNRSPLHLACMKGNYLSASFLVAWGADVKCVDTSGNSPLHLAVLSHNYKLVRLLLIKGSNKNLKNQLGKRPIDIAESSIDKNLKKLLVLIIQRSPSCLSRLNPFRQELDDCKNSPLKFILFSCLYALRAVFQVIVIISQNEVLFYILSLILIFVSIISFLVASCKGPGYLILKNATLSRLIEKYRSEFICPFCECKKNHGTRHCFKCKKCVEVMNS